MSKGRLRKMKKSSVALLMGFALLGSGVTVYADNANYNETLSLPIETYELATQERTSTQHWNSSLRYTSTNCSEATVAFHVRNTELATIVSETVYLTGVSSTWHDVDYKDAYILKKGEMKLYGKTASSHTGYYVRGFWNANGEES